MQKYNKVSEGRSRVSGFQYGVCSELVACIHHVSSSSQTYQAQLWPQLYSSLLVLMNSPNTRLLRGLDAKWGEWCKWKVLCTSLFHDQQILQWPTVCKKEKFMFVPDGWAGRQWEPSLWEPIRSHLLILQEFRAMKFSLGSFFIFLPPPPSPVFRWLRCVFAVWMHVQPRL